MASNHRPVTEYIVLGDSDDEQPPNLPSLQAVSTSNQAQMAASPSGNAGEVTSGLASASISNIASSRTNGGLNGAQNIAPTTSPWNGAANGTAMLLDPVGAITTSAAVPGPSMLRSPQPASDGDRHPSNSSPDVYTGPTPGLEAPLDLNTGPFAPPGPSDIRLNQQPLNSTHRWESDEDDDSPSQTREVIPQEYRTGLVYSSVMMLHALPSFTEKEKEDQDDFHPERPERISQIFDTLKKGGCVARMKRIPIRDVTREEILLIHEKGMWEGVQRTAFFTSNSLSHQNVLLEKASSLYINEHSARCARLSCGGVIEMCDAVASGNVRNGFALVRPPGHHAEPERSMGFCFYNNVAVATRYIQDQSKHQKYAKPCEKILILDWDIHHGNGTQSAFWEDESVLYISIHRYDDGEFFPGGIAGHHSQVGAGRGAGKNVNIPWPDKGMTDADYLAAFQRVIMPIACEFAPDMVIISAGFDAAEGDDLGQCHVSPTGYAQMTYDLASLANGRLVVALEGGYNLDSIAKSALSVTNVLLGETPPSNPAGLSPSSIASDAIKDVEKVQSRYWKSIRRPAYVPIDDEEADNIDKIGLAKLFNLHRRFELSNRFDLEALPIALESRGRDDDMFTGQMLCSKGLFEEAFDTLVIFAHDAGNLRVEEHGVDIEVEEELGYFVDGSSEVIRWASRNNAALIDVNLNVELPAVPKQPISTSSRRGRNPNQSRNSNRLEEDKQLLLYAWDNAAVMVMSAKPGMKVILIGLGTATESVLHLVETRHIEHCVAGVIQLPAYSLIPTISKNSPEKRMWYYKHSMVCLPKEHAYYTLDAQAKAGKRLGKVTRSKESRAIQVLRTEFPAIESYITECLN